MRKELISSLFFAILCIALLLIPTGFEKQIYLNSEGVRATVLETDESGVYNTGLIKQGDQRCLIKIKNGEHKGKTVYANNMYTGKTEFDKVFVKGDTAWVLLDQNKDGEIIFANMIDHYRVGSQLFLIGIFAVLLVCCFGFAGLKILLSFTFSLLFIWKALIPLMLHGFPPLVVALVVGNILSAATLILTLGVNKKAIIAMISTVACSLVTCLLAVGLGELFRINGAVMQWSESLLYAGYENLNLTAVFQAGIYLACSGAILDLAVDITSALEEIVIGNEKIGRVQLFRAGMRIGRSVTGSQASTLLMAYMGSYLSVLMVYMAQGTPMLNILNSKSISAEILHTFVGCIGLILVCPLTAAVSSWIYTKKITA
jgi:uncharacterized membrane protein